MIEPTIRTLLDALTTATVALNVAPESAMPYVVVHKISAPRGETHEGRDGTVVSRIQVDVWSMSYQEAKTIASTLYPLCESTYSGIASIELDNESDDYEPTTKKHHIILDFIVRHNEQIGD